MLALALWVNRREASLPRLLSRVLAMVPAALAANMLRVLTLIAYRALSYPGVESPQTHYFIGFFWMTPFVVMITPHDGRPRAAHLVETLHAAAVLALLAPMTGAPNAILVMLATIACLAECRAREARAAGMAAWALCGSCIAVLAVESFWLPWLLLCPLLARLTPAGIMLAACTNSMVSMQPWSWLLAAGALVITWWRRAQPGIIVPTARASHAPLFFACLLMPFLASTLLSSGMRLWELPSGMVTRAIPPDGYEIRLSGQPDQLGLFCYGAATSDRHHTLRVCLKFRGVDVVDAEGWPGVITDGKHWFREYFIQNDRLIGRYADYVAATFRPWAEPGVHIIFVVECEGQDPGVFSTTCDRLARQFHEQCRQRIAVAASGP